MKGFLYQITDKKIQIKDRRVYLVDNSRNLYKIASLEPVYINLNVNPIVKSNENFIVPVKIYPYGFLMLSTMLPNITFTGEAFELKLLYEVSKMETHKNLIGDFDNVQLFEFSFEIYEAKILDEQEIQSNKPLLFMVRGDLFNLYAECTLERNILTVIESPLIVRRI